MIDPKKELDLHSGVKFGDKVLCIAARNNPRLTMGKVYTVAKEVQQGLISGRPYVSVFDDRGKVYSCHAYRFQTIDQSDNLHVTESHTLEECDGDCKISLEVTAHPDGGQPNELIAIHCNVDNKEIVINRCEFERAAKALSKIKSK